MKIRLSYFYQIRNFKKNMVPVSSAMSDPFWYYADSGPGYPYLDKRGILNGLRLKPIIVQGKCGHNCPCEEKDPTSCDFLKLYRQELEKIDLDRMMNDLNNFSQWYQEQYGIDEEIIIVIMVYEAPRNQCSERQVLIDFFNAHGIECKELDYPIT